MLMCGGERNKRSVLFIRIAIENDFIGKALWISMRELLREHTEPQMPPAKRGLLILARCNEGCYISPACFRAASTIESPIQ